VRSKITIIDAIMQTSRPGTVSEKKNTHTNFVFHFSFSLLLRQLIGLPILF
jgi:hypothetical protein